MSDYLLWRGGCPDPLAVITHDKRVRKAFGRSVHAIEFLLEQPSGIALAECFVTDRVAHPRTATPLPVFLDLRKPRKGETDIRLLERPKRLSKADRKRVDLDLKPRASGRVSEGPMGSGLPMGQVT